MLAAIEFPLFCDLRREGMQPTSRPLLRLRWGQVKIRSPIRRNYAGQAKRRSHFALTASSTIVQTPPDNHIHHKPPLIWYVFIFKDGTAPFQTNWPTGRAIEQLSETVSANSHCGLLSPGISWPAPIIRNIFAFYFLGEGGEGGVSSNLWLCRLHTGRMIEVAGVHP